MNKPILLTASLVLASWTVTAAEPPQVTYLGNFPGADGFAWSELQNGVTHDDANWYLTQEGRLWKIPVTWRLDNDFSIDNLPPGVRTVAIPQELQNCKFDHFGDLDHLDGFLLIPVEKTASTPSDSGCPSGNALAVFRAADLSYVGSALLPAIAGESPERFPGRFPWVAFNPVDGLLYTSENTIDNGRPLYRFTIDLDALKQNCGVPTTDPVCGYSAFINDLPWLLGFKDKWGLYESDGTLLTEQLGQYIQGGDFSDNGYLYLANGKTSSVSDPDGRNGIHVVDPAGRIVADSYNPGYSCSGCLSGSFPFEFDPKFPDFEEPEGLDWWDLDDPNAPDVPGIKGQLHVMLLGNQLGTDDIFFKHYRVVESGCTVDCDRDGDGLTDAEEAALGTNPTAPDSDGDGLIDGNEVNDYHTDPLDADTDDDGLTDGSEINLHLTDPTAADSDGDGLSDGREVNDLHTNPLDFDSDDDGLSDGREVDELRTNPLDADSDDDGLLDGLEVEVGTDPNDADTDNDGIADGRDVEFVEQQLLAMLDTAFRSRGPGAREQLLQHLTVLESAVQSNNLVAAKAALDTLLRMMDGCGAEPDADDIVRDCASQLALRELVVLLRVNLGLS
jgi:hypothetical protein